MACLYDMSELGLPLTEVRVEAARRLGPDQEPSSYGSVVHTPHGGGQLEVRGRSFYTLRVCKGCRADWLTAVKVWFNTTPSYQDQDGDDDPRGPGTGIFVRENGATVELTREEWDRRNPGREPVVVKPQESP